MCNQTVGLVAAELERRGISTVTIQLLREVAERVRPPRSLVVPYRHGYPLGSPGEPDQQMAVLMNAFRLFGARGPGPVLEELDPAETLTFCERVHKMKPRP